MAATLTFRHLFHYTLNQIGVTIPVRLQWGNTQAVFTAKVDTGASFCIFARAHGEALGLDIEAGRGGMDLGLKNKIAMVAGASRGLGYAVARGLAAEGAKVSISSRNEQAITDAAKRIAGETSWTGPLP